MPKKKQQDKNITVATLSDEVESAVQTTDPVLVSAQAEEADISVISADVIADEQKPEAEIMAEAKENEAKAVLEEQTALAASTVSLGDPSIEATPVVTPSAEKSEEALADKVRVISPMKLVLKRFFRSKLSVIGLVTFIAILVFSFLGPLFVGWGEDEVDWTKVTGADSFMIQYSKYQDGVDEDGNPIYVEYSYYTISTENFKSMNNHASAGSYGYNKEGKYTMHVLGTDAKGYDVFVRLMYGGRLSLMLSFLVVIIYTVIGIIMGGLAGYFGGWVDMIIMRIVDILNCVPSLPILLIVGAIFDGSGLPESIRIYIMMGALTLLSWTGTARLVRGQILFLREQEYMIAAEALGFSSTRKIFKHLVPNVMPQLIVSMTLGLGGTILTEASLSFLGLGAPDTFGSLGQMISAANGNREIILTYVGEWLPAGLIIILAVVAFNFIGDGLRDALDPKMKR